MLATQERSLSGANPPLCTRYVTRSPGTPGSTPCVCPKIAGPNIRWLESSIHGFPMFSTIFDGHKLCPMSSPCQDTFRRHHVSIKIGLPVIGGSLCLNTSNGHLSIKNCPEYGCPMLPTAGLLNAALDDEKNVFQMADFSVFNVWKL